MKHTNCTVPDCPNYEKYCRVHISGEKTNHTKIKKESEKRGRINRKDYAPKSQAFVRDNPICEVESPDCKKLTQCVHHLKGKDTIEDLLDENYWMPACVPCNNYVEKHDAWARANGKKLSKHAGYERKKH